MNDRVSKFVITIEGLDGVGKTSVTSELARRLGAVGLKTPNPLYGKTGRLLDDAPGALSYFYFLLSSVHYTSERILSSQKRLFVCDRYALSILSYRAPFGIPLRFNCGDLKICPPSREFLLTASETVRSQRLRTSRRLLSPSELQLEGNCRMRETILKHFRSSPGIVEIDTTRLSIQQVVRRVLLHLRDEGHCPVSQ